MRAKIILLLDEDVRVVLAEILRQRGYDVSQLAVDSTCGQISV